VGDFSGYDTSLGDVNADGKSDFILQSSDLPDTSGYPLRVGAHGLHCPTAKESSTTLSRGGDWQVLMIGNAERVISTVTAREI
jgi:hypothetical protein